MKPTLTATIGRPLCLSIPLLLFMACAREELTLGSGELGSQAPIATAATASSPPAAPPTVGGACGSMSCGGLGPGIIPPCDYCNTDSDCRIVDQTCTDPASDCGCRAYSRSGGESVSCRPCDAQACANKVAFCMITGTAPVPAPPAGQPPAPPKPEGICAVRDAP
jgi:hypothetical protein